MEQICVTCAARSPEAGSVYELIGELGWRPRWEKGSIRHPATEWLCPTCWQEFKEAAMQGFPSTQRMLAQAKSQEGIPVQRLRSADLFGIVIADSEGRFKQANDAFLRIVGRTREELVSGPDDWKANTPFEWLSGGGSAFAALAADGSLPLHEEVYVGPDGHSVTMLVGGSLLPGTGGDCVGIVVDISERKRVEAELLTVTAFLDSVVENLPHMIFVKDAAELRFQRINKAGEDLLGVQRGERGADPDGAGRALAVDQEDRDRRSAGDRAASSRHLRGHHGEAGGGQPLARRARAQRRGANHRARAGQRRSPA